jgi:alkanesulfonate monooxygenase SsuD/methylene tetrahydromethanopterin reductase-like flavin-dependent oxidoreductase (luciferase family)
VALPSSQAPELATICGISIAQVRNATFALGAAMAGLAGVLIAPSMAPDPQLDALTRREMQAVCEAEELGFHSNFVVEHHFTGIQQVSASLNLLSFLAAKTKKIRLGTGVVVLPWHNPILLAEQVATLDLLSNGRFDFGVGRGYRPNEFAGFCIPPEEANERYEEALEVLMKALGPNQRFSHHGKRWHFENVLVEPPVVQRPFPFWVGAGSAPSIKGAADRGFSLLLDQFGTVETTADRIASFRTNVELQGKAFDPLTVGLTCALHVAMNEHERNAAYQQRADFYTGIQKLGAADAKSSLSIPNSLEATRAATEQSALIGAPDEIVARIEALRAIGVEYIILIDVGGSISALRTFAREVMPAFQ